MSSRYRKPIQKTVCRNCGRKEYGGHYGADDKIVWGCEACGFVEPSRDAVRELPETRIVECTRCGKSYREESEEAANHVGHPRVTVDPTSRKRREYPPPSRMFSP